MLVGLVICRWLLVSELQRKCNQQRSTLQNNHPLRCFWGQLGEKYVSKTVNPAGPTADNRRMKY